MNSFSKSITSRWLIRGEIVKRLQSSTSSDIKIPNRIERGPTDILKALESTISRDHTAAHYKFHDDPYLIPTSTRLQRTYALARESGKKAAMWVLKEHADLFQHKVADPIIEAFIPKVVYKDKNDVSEEILLNIIHSGQVEEALNVYNLLEEQVSDETKQALLEMLCYCNSKSLVSEELIEERWYTITSRRPINNWRNHPDLTKLFEYLKNQGGEKAAKAYCALISGTAKHYNVNKSWELFQECRDQNIPLSVNVYNYILQLIPAVKDNTSKKKESVEEILNLMAAQGLQPNTQTWNACLSVVRYIKNSSEMQEYVRSVFAEFNQLNIQPSLATYYHVLVAFYAQDNSSNSVILTILNEIEKKNFTVIEDLDLFFFVTAMETAERLQDREIADKIHNLLLTGDNYKFIGDNNKESIYYRHYLFTVLKTQPFEEFMQFYSKLVPNIYIPEPKVMKEILYCLEINLPEISREYLPRIWSHMIIFNCLDREDLTSAAFNLMCTHCAPESPESPLHQVYKEAALAMWKHIQNEIGKKFSRLVLNAVTCGDIALLLLRGDELGQAIEVISFMVKEVGKLNGQMKIESMNELFDACILQGHTIGALLMVQYAIDNGFEEASAMGQRIYKNIPLSQNQEQKLTSLVGSAILQMEIPEEDDKETQDKVKAK